MRSIWKGSLVFGLVNVPVAVYSATEDHDIRFHQVHEADGGRIRYSRVCEVCGNQIPYADIVKSYQDDDGRTAVITDEDFKSLPEAGSDREIDLLSFVPAEQIDPVLYDQSYLLEPGSKSPKAYVLLREVLAETDRVAIVHFALRQKTRLAALRVRDDVLLIQTLRWPDEVRAADFAALDTQVSVSAAEKKMATLLIDSYADDFHPEQHEDAYRIQLQQLIDAKLEGEQAFPDRPADEGEDAEVLDLLAALQRSVEKQKGSAAKPSSGGGSEDSAGSQDPSSPEKKPTRRRTTRSAAGSATPKTEDGEAKAGRRSAASTSTAKAKPTTRKTKSA